VEVILRMLTVKQLYQLSYEQTEYRERNRLVLSQFPGIFAGCVDDTTLIHLARLFQLETLHLYF
jgi:hypothetical protein